MTGFEVVLFFGLFCAVVIIGLVVWLTRSDLRAVVVMQDLRDSRCKREVDDLENDVAALKRRQHAHLACGDGLTLVEMLPRVGLRFENLGGPWEYSFIPAAIRDSFAKQIEPDEDGSVPARCQSCGERADFGTIWCDCPTIHPGQSLGIFCLDCGVGRLFPGVSSLRDAAGLPPLPDGQLRAIIQFFEDEALRLGLKTGDRVAPAPTEDLPN